MYLCFFLSLMSLTDGTFNKYLHCLIVYVEKLSQLSKSCQRWSQLCSLLHFFLFSLVTSTMVGDKQQKHLVKGKSTFLQSLTRLSFHLKKLVKSSSSI